MHLSFANFRQMTGASFREVLLGAACVLILTGCQTATPSIETQVPGMPVKLGVATSSLLDNSTTFLAQLKSRRSVPLKPQVSGEILEIHVRSGDKVEKAELLLRLDDAKQQSTVRALQASAESFKDDRNHLKETMQSLQASRVSKIARLEFTQQELTRYTDLFSQGAVSKENVEEHHQNLKIAQSDLSSLDSQIKAQRALVDKNEKQLKQCEAQIKEQQTQLQYFSIRSPQAGSIGDVPVKVGEYVTSSTVLTTLEEPGPLEVYINVPANHAEQLKVGLPVVYRNSAGAIAAHGQVFFVSQEVNNSDQSILVKAVFDNADAKLRTGQLINVQLVWDKQNVLLVPTSAVTHLSGKDFVFVAEKVGNGLVAKQKNIQTGEIEGDSYRVMSGLNAGDQIVVSGVQNLMDGAPLKPQ